MFAKIATSQSQENIFFLAFLMVYAIARPFSFLARFWINAQYPKTRDRLSMLSAKKKNGLTMLINLVAIISM